jgi:hypothetical protein
MSFRSRSLLAAHALSPARAWAGTVILILLGFCSPGLAVDAPTNVAVSARRAGDTIVVDTVAFVPVPPKAAWQVLTDFEHMTRIMPDLEVSRVLSRDADGVIVQQRGKASRGPFTFTFETVRRIRLRPYEEIEGKLLSGTMKKSEGVTRLIAEGTGTRIVSHGEFIPDFWIPPLIGVKVIEMETRRQFEGLIREILRRNGGGTPAG